MSKKGVAGGIWQDLNVGWFYDWNIGQKSTPDLEYVPIRQNRHWPGLDQDWKVKGSTHLLGFNEPERQDQANMTVDAAISTWPLLLATGLRLGAPAPSDGGLGWLYEFMDKADAANLRVEDVRFIKRNDGSLTPAGVVYRDQVSPISHNQAKPGR